MSVKMDIQMPVMDGIEATKEIRRLERAKHQGFSSTPVHEDQPSPSDTASMESKSSTIHTPFTSSVIIVALTASSLEADRISALAAGCNDFLTKPVSLKWLNSKIIEWGSIKALQMWADLRPDVAKSITAGQIRQARTVADNLRVPQRRGSRPQSPARSTALEIDVSMSGTSSVSAQPSPRHMPSPRPRLEERLCKPFLPPLLSSFISEVISIAERRSPGINVAAVLDLAEGGKGKHHPRQENERNLDTWTPGKINSQAAC